jgi:hypothetical protein
MSDERGHLVPPGWLEANGFTPESWQRFVDEFGRECRTGRVRLLTPLPRRTRLRLWRQRRIDGIACWLAEHVSPGVAIVLWRACGMWR